MKIVKTCKIELSKEEMDLIMNFIGLTSSDSRQDIMTEGWSLMSITKAQTAAEALGKLYSEYEDAIKEN